MGPIRLHRRSPHYAAIASIIFSTPTIFSTRVKLYVSTQSAISAATFGNVVHRKCVAPMRIFMVPKGCSTVSRRVRMASGFLSSLSCTGLDNPLVLPPRDATLSSRRALSFDWAGMARIGPITAKFLAVLLSRKTVREFLTGRAHLYVLLRLIAKILLAEPARRLRAGCHRFRQRHGDAGVVARFDRLAVEVPAVGDGLELVDAERLLRCCRRA